MRILLSLALILTSIGSFASEKKTVIYLMVDGLRYDYVKHHVTQMDQLPNLKKYFFDEGTIFENSFTTLPLTVPSWSEILSGQFIDQSNFIGNDIFNVETKHIENYLDWRRDFIISENLEHGRAYRRMLNSSQRLVIDYFNRGVVQPDLFLDEYEEEESSVFTTFIPLNDHFPVYMALDNILYLDILTKQGLVPALVRAVYEDKGFNGLDRASHEKAMQVIADQDSKKKDFIALYLAGVDHYTHQVHSKGIDTLQQIDRMLGETIRLIKRSRYRDSIIVLMSDHGMLGGHEYPTDDNYQNPLRGLSYNLTSTNVCNLLTGRTYRPGFGSYQMNITSPFAAEGRYAKFGDNPGQWISNFNLNEYFLHSYQCTNVSYDQWDEKGTCSQIHKKDVNKVHGAYSSTQALTLPAGYFDSGQWNRRNSWYELTHYGVGRDGSDQLVRRNLIADLSNVEIDNLRVLPTIIDGHIDSYNPQDNLRQIIGYDPIDWIAAPISMDDYNNFIIGQSGLRFETAMRDVILLYKNDSNQALIVSKNFGDRLQVAYYPIRNFSQNRSGQISFTSQADRDPLKYISELGIGRSAFKKQFGTYKGFRELISTTKTLTYPTALMAIPKLFFANPSLPRDIKNDRIDLLFSPNYGHYIGCGDDSYQANHGMLQRESVRNSFMVHGPNVKKGLRVQRPVFSVDILPTALRGAHGASWKKLKPINTPHPSYIMDGRAQDSIFK